MRYGFTASFLLALLPAAPALAGIEPASNLGGAARVFTPYQYGGKGDTERYTNCNVTTTAGQATLSVAGCGNIFAATDVGKILVVNNAGGSATTPLVTTIAGYTSATQVTMGANAGQTLAGSNQAVTFGSDDGPALQSCITNAATGADSSYCYIPPASGGFWGSAQTLELYPSSKNATVVGAGRYVSQVIALASLSSLVHRNAGYLQGGVLRDIGFDGNHLATDVGYFVCAAFRHDSNVGFYNADSHAGLVYGDATGSGTNCNTSRIVDIEVGNFTAGLYGGGDYPTYGIVVGNTDTTIINPVIRETGTTSLHIPAIAEGIGQGNNTVVIGAHCFSPASGASKCIVANAVVVRLIDTVCDNGITTCIDIQNNQVSVYGGIYQGAVGGAIGVNVAAGKTKVVVNGFDGSAIATQADRVKLNATIGANVCALGNPSAIDYCPPVGGLTVLGSDNTPQMTVQDTASAANYISLAATAAGAAPLIQPVGSDTNINFRISAKGTGVIVAQVPVQLKSYTVATLPACSGSVVGAMARVTDATAPTYNATLTGGGGVAIPVFCDGTNWRAH